MCEKYKYSYLGDILLKKNLLVLQLNSIKHLAYWQMDLCINISCKGRLLNLIQELKSSKFKKLYIHFIHFQGMFCWENGRVRGYKIERDRKVGG